MGGVINNQAVYLNLIRYVSLDILPSTDHFGAL